LGGQSSDACSRGNYHAHLVSPAASKARGGRPIATVDLPPELARVFDEYQRGKQCGDDSAFCGVFTEDALFPGVMAGSEVIGQFVQTAAQTGIGAFGRKRSTSRTRPPTSPGWSPMKPRKALRTSPDSSLRYVDVRTVLADQRSVDRESQPARARAGDSVNSRSLIAQLDSAGIRRRRRVKRCVLVRRHRRPS